MGSEHATTTSSSVATGRDPRTARRAFWLTLVGVFLAVGAWSIANPIMAAPDEPAHALATDHGDWPTAPCDDGNVWQREHAGLI